jgi:hypothetical protein
MVDQQWGKGTGKPDGAVLSVSRADRWAGRRTLGDRGTLFDRRRRQQLIAEHVYGRPSFILEPLLRRRRARSGIWDLQPTWT